MNPEGLLQNEKQKPKSSLFTSDEERRRENEKSETKLEKPMNFINSVHS